MHTSFLTALVIALVELILAVFKLGVDGLYFAILLAMILVLIRFGDALGGYANPFSFFTHVPINKPTSGIFIRAFGWLALLGLLGVIILGN
ncbi:MAG: hypothetical protein HY397_00740 [Candidatus Doudnabacteria bacterium]|nr:hypothetical protein [Candidatus Doudnabacteria bacterium]